MAGIEFDRNATNAIFDSKAADIQLGLPVRAGLPAAPSSPPQVEGMLQGLRAQGEAYAQPPAPPPTPTTVGFNPDTMQFQSGAGIFDLGNLQVATEAISKGALSSGVSGQLAPGFVRTTPNEIAAYIDRTAKDRGFWSAAGGVAKQAAAGLFVEMPKTIGDAATFYGNQMDSDVLRGIGKVGHTAAKGWGLAMPSLEQPADTYGRGRVATALMEASRQAAPSLASAVPAMLVPGGLPAQLAASAVSAYGLFGGAQGQETYEKLTKAGVDPAEASKAAWTNVFIEGTGETIGETALVRMLGSAGNVARPAINALRGLVRGGKMTAAQAAEIVIKPAALRTFATELGLNSVVQGGTEFGQQLGESMVENAYSPAGQKLGGDPWAQAAHAAEVGGAMAFLMSPLGIPGHVRASRTRAAIGQALQNPDNPVDMIKATDIVRREITPMVGEQAATEWMDTSFQRLDARQAELDALERSRQENYARDEFERMAALRANAQHVTDAQRRAEDTWRRMDFEQQQRDITNSTIPGYVAGIEQNAELNPPLKNKPLPDEWLAINAEQRGPLNEQKAFWKQQAPTAGDLYNPNVVQTDPATRQNWEMDAAFNPYNGVEPTGRPVQPKVTGPAQPLEQVTTRPMQAPGVVPGTTLDLPAPAAPEDAEGVDTSWEALDSAWRQTPSQRVAQPTPDMFSGELREPAAREEMYPTLRRILTAYTAHDMGSVLRLARGIADTLGGRHAKEITQLIHNAKYQGNHQRIMTRLSELAMLADKKVADAPETPGEKNRRQMDAVEELNKAFAPESKNAAEGVERRADLYAMQKEAAGWVERIAKLRKQKKSAGEATRRLNALELRFRMMVEGNKLNREEIARLAAEVQKIIDEPTAASPNDRKLIPGDRDVPAPPDGGSPNAQHIRKLAYNEWRRGRLSADKYEQILAYTEGSKNNQKAENILREQFGGQLTHAGHEEVKSARRAELDQYEASDISDGTELQSNVHATAIRNAADELSAATKGDSPTNEDEAYTNLIRALAPLINISRHGYSDRDTMMEADIQSGLATPAAIGRAEANVKTLLDEKVITKHEIDEALIYSRRMDRGSGEDQVLQRDTFGSWGSKGETFTPTKARAISAFKMRLSDRGFNRLISAAARKENVSVDQYVSQFLDDYEAFKDRDRIDESKEVARLSLPSVFVVDLPGGEQQVVTEDHIERMTRDLIHKSRSPEMVRALFEQFKAYPEDVLDALLAAKSSTYTNYTISAARNMARKVDENATISPELKIAQELYTEIATPDPAFDGLTSLTALKEAGGTKEISRRYVVSLLNDIVSEANRDLEGADRLTVARAIVEIAHGRSLDLSPAGKKKLSLVTQFLNGKGDALGVGRKWTRLTKLGAESRANMKALDEHAGDFTEALQQGYDVDSDAAIATEEERRSNAKKRATLNVGEAVVALAKAREALTAAKRSRNEDRISSATLDVEQASIALEGARHRRDVTKRELDAVKRGRSLDAERGAALAAEMAQRREAQAIAEKQNAENQRRREAREVKQILEDLDNMPITRLQKALQSKGVASADAARIREKIAAIEQEKIDRRKAEERAAEEKRRAEEIAKIAENTPGAFAAKGRSKLSASDRAALATALGVKADTIKFWAAVQKAFNQWNANQYVDGFKSARDFDYYGNKLGVKKRNVGAVEGGMTQQAAQDVVDQLKKRWKNAPTITVLQSGEGHPDYRAGDKGWYDASNNQVVVIAENSESSADLVATILHEVEGHYGLAGSLGDELNGVLDEAYKNKDVRTAVESHRARPENAGQSVRIATEEVLSNSQMRGPSSRYFDKLVAAINRFARRIGIRSGLSNAEIREVLRKAREFAENGPTPGGGPGKGVKKLNGGVATAINAIYGNAKDSSLLGRTAKDLANRGMLSLMFGSDLANYARAHGIPAAIEFYKNKAYKDTIRQEHERVIENVMRRVHNFSHQEKIATNQVLETLTSGEQWHKIYPWMDKKLKEKLGGEQAQMDKAMEESGYLTLLPETQRIVDDVLRIGYETQRRKRDLLNAEINAEFQPRFDAAKDEDRKAIRKEWDSAISTKGKFLAELAGPYVPFKRPGDILVIGKSAEFLKNEQIRDDETASDDARKAARKWIRENVSSADHYRVTGAENDSDAGQIMDGYKKDMVGGAAYRTVKEQYRSPYGHEMPFHFVKQMRNIAEEEFGSDSVQSKTVNRLITDLYVQMLSDERARKSELRRMKVAGYSPDMMQSFAMQGFADAHLLSALEGNEAVTASINEMRKQKNAVQREGVDDLKAARVYNQIMANHTASMFYTSPTNWQEKMASFTSVWKLTTSPAYWITNLTQTPMMTLPEIGGRHGITKAWSEWLKSYETVTAAMREDVVDFHDLKGKDGKPLLTKSEADAMTELYRRGRFDITLAQDLGRFIRTGTLHKTLAGKVVDAVESNTLTQGAKIGVEAIMRIPANVEMINRISTGIAAYRLEYERAVKDGMSHEKAAEQAIVYSDNIIKNTHGDYSSGAAPGLLQQGGKAVPMKLLGQFRKFQILQLGQIMRLSWEAVSDEAYKGQDMSAEDIAEAKKSARLSLMYLSGMYATMAGALGVPFLYNVAALLAWIAGVGDDKDEPPVSFKAWTPFANADDRKMVEFKIRKMFGDNQEAALLFSRGLPAALGLDMSGRLGAGAITQLLPYAQSGKDAKSEIANALLAISGPFLGSLVPDMYNGVSQIAQGDYVKGIAQIMPKGVGDIVRAGDLKVRGRTDGKDTVLVNPEEFGAMQIAMSGIGLMPTAFSQRSFTQSMLKTVTEYYSGISTKLREEYRTGDKDAARKAWDEMNAGRVDLGLKEVPIKELFMSERDFEKRQRNVLHGVLTTNQNRGFVEKFH